MTTGGAVEQLCAIAQRSVLGSNILLQGPGLLLCPAWLTISYSHSISSTSQSDKNIWQLSHPHHQAFFLYSSSYPYLLLGSRPSPTGLSDPHIFFHDQNDAATYSLSAGTHHSFFIAELDWNGWKMRRTELSNYEWRVIFTLRLIFYWALGARLQDGYVSTYPLPHSAKLWNLLHTLPGKSNAFK